MSDRMKFAGGTLRLAKSIKRIDNPDGSWPPYVEVLDHTTGDKRVLTPEEIEALDQELFVQVSKE